MQIQRFEAIEVTILNAGQTRVQIPDHPNLRNARIDRVVIYPQSVVQPSFLTGQSVATNTDLQQCSITLYEGDLQVVYNAPLIQFNNAVSPNNELATYQVPLDFAGITISWTKSYISTPVALDSYPATFSIGVFYHF
jgi:hypothetical protein